MKRLLLLSLVFAIMGCNPVGEASQASPLARYSGQYSNSNGTLLVTISDNHFDLKCYPKTDAERKKFESSFSVELKGEITKIQIDTVSGTQIDTSLVLNPDSFFRINADNSTTKLDSISFGGKSFDKAPLVLVVQSEYSGYFVNYFGLESIQRQL